MVASACGSNRGSGAPSTRSSNGLTTVASRTSSSPERQVDPCKWVTKGEVERVLGTQVADGHLDSELRPFSCSFKYRSSTKVETDLVIGDWNPVLGTPGAPVPGRQRAVVAGLGDRAVFLKAKTIDEGNSVLTVTTHGSTFVIAGEFLTLDAGKQLARIVLGRR
jgi:hypothetical protein